MKLRLLIILRHGEPGPGDFLTQEAREAMMVLGTQLKTEHGLVAKTTMFLGSKKLRALKTMQSIAIGAGLQKSLHEICRDEFFSDDRTCDVEKALVIIDEFGQQFEVLVVVSHNEMMEVLPRAFGKKFKISVPENRLKYGQGYVINLTDRSWKQIA